jgi:hypothetical protein
MTKFIFDHSNESLDILWTTERLIDELFIDLSSTSCEIKKLGNDGVYQIIHFKKYYRQALNKFYRIPLWTPAPSFIISISDLSEKVKSELDNYYKAGCRNMFNYIVTEAVGRLFENIDRIYFHQSIMKNLKVIFQ